MLIDCSPLLFFALIITFSCGVLGRELLLGIRGFLDYVCFTILGKKYESSIVTH